jgi:hypothetical protein
MTDIVCESTHTDELTTEDLEQLLELLGGAHKVALFKESQFCQEAGCTPDQLEHWLKAYWRQHDISMVLGGTKRVERYPTLLVKEHDGYLTLRLFSPTRGLLGTSKRKPRRAATQ